MTKRMTKYLPLLPVGVSSSTAMAVLTMPQLREISVIAVTILGGMLSVGAFYLNYRVSRSKERATDAEAQEHLVNVTKIRRQLCEECQKGLYPSACVWPEDERPEDCPHRKK